MPVLSKPSRKTIARIGFRLLVPDAMEKDPGTGRAHQVIVTQNRNDRQALRLAGVDDRVRNDIRRKG